jgi:predicted metal-dependent hydrolase
MKQHPLPFVLQNNETYLKNYFQKRCNKPIIFILTDNATSMISVRGKKDAISLRLHRIFLSADERVLDEVAEFIKGKGGNRPAIKAFIRNNRSCLKDSPPRTVTINPYGRFYNLTDIFNSLNREYFDDRVASLVTWGKKSSRYAVRKRTLGSYQQKTNTIRINPILDRKKVPRYVIEFVVYHEMLHAVIDTVVKNGRRSIHSKEFNNREHEYRNYDKAIEWEKRVFRK